MASEFDAETRYASLSERVNNQGSQINALEAEMRRSFSALSSGLDSINAKLADTSKPQWQALGVMLTAIVVVGSLAYWPIRETQQRIESTVATMATNFQTSIDTTNKRFDNVLSLQQFEAFKNTYENNRALSRLDNNARFEKIERGMEQTVPRAEHERVWLGIDQRFADMQRQVDQNTQANTSVYTQRDQMMSMQAELENLRKLLLNRQGTQGM